MASQTQQKKRSGSKRRKKRPQQKKYTITCRRDDVERACDALSDHFCEMSHIHRTAVYWLRSLIELYFYRPGEPLVLRPKYARICHWEIINKVAEEHPEVAEKWIKKGKISRNYWNIVGRCTYLGRNFGKLRKADDPAKALLCCFEHFQPASERRNKYEINLFFLTEAAHAVLDEEFGGGGTPSKNRKRRNIRAPRGGKYKEEPKGLEEELRRQAEPKGLKEELRREPEELPIPEELLREAEEQIDQNREAAAELRRRGINFLDYGMPPEQLLEKLDVENSVENSDEDCNILQSRIGDRFSSSLRSEEKLLKPPITPPEFPQPNSPQEPSLQFVQDEPDKNAEAPPKPSCQTRHAHRPLLAGRESPPKRTLWLKFHCIAAKKLSKIGRKEKYPLPKVVPKSPCLRGIRKERIEKWLLPLVSKELSLLSVQNIVHTARVPFRIFAFGFDPLLVKLLRYLRVTISFFAPPLQLAKQLALRRVAHQLAVDPIPAKRDLAQRIALLLLVLQGRRGSFADEFPFHLGHGAHDGQEELTHGAIRVDLLGDRKKAGVALLENLFDKL